MRESIGSPINWHPGEYEHVIQQILYFYDRY